MKSCFCSASAWWNWSKEERQDTKVGGQSLERVDGWPSFVVGGVSGPGLKRRVFWDKQL
jgi:hypothetical protein